MELSAHATNIYTINTVVAPANRVHKSVDYHNIMDYYTCTSTVLVFYGVLLLILIVEYKTINSGHLDL